MSVRVAFTIYVFFPLFPLNPMTFVSYSYICHFLYFIFPRHLFACITKTAKGSSDVLIGVLTLPLVFLHASQNHP